MRLGRKLVFTAVFLTLVLCRGVSRADTTLVIYPGPGGFSLRGEYLDNVTSMDITVDYDAAALSQPRINRGNGLGQSQFDANTGSSGSVGIRIKSPKPLRGIVMLANLAFTRQGDEPGSISDLRAFLSDKNGNSVPVKVSIINPAARKDATASRGNEGRGQPPVTSRTSTQPQPAPTRESKQEPAAVSPENEQPRVPAAVVSSAPSSPTFIRLESVLDHFRQYTGPRTLQDLRKLFTLPDTGISQQPAVALSDGTSTVRISVLQTTERNRAPVFLLRGAHHVSLQKSASAWEIEVLPDQGTHEASLTVLDGADLREFPLTVSPPLNLFDATTAGPDLAEFVRAANGLACSGSTTIAVKKN